MTRGNYVVDLFISLIRVASSSGEEQNSRGSASPEMPQAGKKSRARRRLRSLYHLITTPVPTYTSRVLRNGGAAFPDRNRAMIRREWVLKHNCPISPRQLAMAYAILGLLIVAILFAVHGAWYILGFAILEMLAVGLAFLHCACHATERKRIGLLEDYLLVGNPDLKRIAGWSVWKAGACG